MVKMQVYETIFNDCNEPMTIHIENTVKNTMVKIEYGQV